MGMVACFKQATDEKIRELRSNPEKLSDFLYEDNSSIEIDLDKSWHAIHYLLNDSVWDVAPGAGEIILGGKPISDEDLGYGPARYLRSAELASIYQELMLVSTDDLLLNFKEMVGHGDQVYPGFSDDDVDRHYVRSNFEALKSFCESAIDNKMGLMLYLT